MRCGGQPVETRQATVLGEYRGEWGAVAVLGTTFIETDGVILIREAGLMRSDPVRALTFPYLRRRTILRTFLPTTLYSIHEICLPTSSRRLSRGITLSFRSFLPCLPASMSHALAQPTSTSSYIARCNYCDAFPVRQQLRYYSRPPCSAMTQKRTAVSSSLLFSSLLLAPISSAHKRRRLTMARAPLARRSLDSSTLAVITSSK